jgi:hypothetical protein
MVSTTRTPPAGALALSPAADRAQQPRAPMLTTHSRACCSTNAWAASTLLALVLSWPAGGSRNDQGSVSTAKAAASGQRGRGGGAGILHAVAMCDAVAAPP